MKSSYIKRNAQKTGSDAWEKITKSYERGRIKKDEYKAFMKQFFRVPCAVCGKTSCFKSNDPTVGHHILYRSTHPEYSMTEENIVPLCPLHHTPFAHERPNEFIAWLKEHRPEAWEWREKHNNHLQQ